MADVPANPTAAPPAPRPAREPVPLGWLVAVLLVGAMLGIGGVRLAAGRWHPVDPARWQIRLGKLATEMIKAFSLSFEPGLRGGRFGLTLHAEAEPQGLPERLALPARIFFEADFLGSGNVSVRLPAAAPGDLTEHRLTFDPRDDHASGFFASTAERSQPIEGCTRRAVASPFPSGDHPFELYLDRHRWRVMLDGQELYACAVDVEAVGRPFFQAGAADVLLDDVSISAADPAAAGGALHTYFRDDFAHPLEAPAATRVAAIAGALALVAIWLAEGALLRALARDAAGHRLLPGLAFSLTPLMLLATVPPERFENLRLQVNLVRSTNDELLEWCALGLVVLLQAIVLFRHAPLWAARTERRSGAAAAAVAAVLAGFVAAGLGVLAYHTGIKPLFWGQKEALGTALAATALYVALRTAFVALMRLASRELPASRIAIAAARTDLPLAGVLAWLGYRLLVGHGVPEALGPNPWALVCLAGMASALLRMVFLAANAERVHALSPLMLVGFAAIVGYAEGGLRTTYLNGYWFPYWFGSYQRDDIYGWTKRQLQTIESGSWFPNAAGDPTQVPHPGKRIVCLGGSTTDMGPTSYTVFLQELLDREKGPGEWAVLNLGVGGWDTSRIVRYIEQFVPRLEPAIVLLYVGYNDGSYTGVPLTMREIGEHAAARSSAVAWLRDKLNQSRLYVGYRKLLFAVLNRNITDRIAVPPDDTRANLTGIQAVADRLGAKLLLVSEAVATADDRPRMAPYEQVMREFADAKGSVHYVAGQVWIDAANRTDLFEDLVHPTAAGARIIARGMFDTLDQLGWTTAAPAPAPAPPATP